MPGFAGFQHGWFQLARSPAGGPVSANTSCGNSGPFNARCDMALIAVTPTVNAELKRSTRRRSIGIKVHRGEVTVSAALRARVAEIQAFVASKARWIDKHLELQRESADRPTELHLVPGALLSFLGQTLRLEMSAQPYGVVR